MIALTPQSLKWVRFEFARNGFSQKSGKTKAPTIGLDGNSRLLNSQGSAGSFGIQDDYHNEAALLETVVGTTSPGAS
jgi:hypothetical protein